MRNVIRTFIYLLLIAAMFLCLTACGKDTSGLGTLEIGASSQGGELAPLGGSNGQDSDSDTKSSSELDPKTSSEPTPESTSEPEKEFAFEEFSSSYFDCCIPKGWSVNYQTVDAGNGVTRIYVFVQDPSDANNIIFYVSGMEPCFTSYDDKKVLLSVLNNAYEWAPVLNELSAAGLLEQWASWYTLMDATGFTDGAKYFRNYSIVSILNSIIADGATAAETASQVIAEVSIPNSSKTYGMLFANDFVRMHYPYADADFYVSYYNRGFVLSADRFSTEAENMAYCTTSFDFTKFNNKFGSSTNINDDEGNSNAVNPEIVLPIIDF